MIFYCTLNSSSDKFFHNLSCSTINCLYSSTCKQISNGIFSHVSISTKQLLKFHRCFNLFFGTPILKKIFWANEISKTARPCTRKVPFLVIFWTSTTKNQIWNGTTRNKERPDFKKKMGTRSFCGGLIETVKIHRTTAMLKNVRLHHLLPGNSCEPIHLTLFGVLVTNKTSVIKLRH